MGLEFAMHFWLGRVLQGRAQSKEGKTGSAT